MTCDMTSCNCLHRWQVWMSLRNARKGTSVRTEQDSRHRILVHLVPTVTKQSWLMRHNVIPVTEDGSVTLRDLLSHRANATLVSSAPKELHSDSPLMMRPVASVPLATTVLSVLQPPSTVPLERTDQWKVGGLCDFPWNCWHFDTYFQ